MAKAFTKNDTTLVMKSLFEFFAGADIQDQMPPEILQSLKVNLTEMKALVNSKDPFPEFGTNLKPPFILLPLGILCPC